MSNVKSRGTPRGTDNTPGDTHSVASYDSTGKQKSFRRLFTRFAEKTSMQGVPYINMAKFWWARVMWVILLLTAVGIMCAHLWYLFDQWYTYPKNTKIELGFETLDFPQVTICNLNVLHKGRLNTYNGSSELKWLIKDLEPENIVPEQWVDDYQYETTTPDDGQTTTEANVRTLFM